MRVFDGRETLEFERTGEELRVLLTGNQIRMASMDVIRQHASIDDETPEEYQAAITYAVAAGSRTLRRASFEAKTRVAKLELAQKLSSVRGLANKFRVPFLHPDNVSLSGGGVSLAHFGLVGMLAPMEFDEALFVKGYKALVLSVFHPRLPFEKLVDGSAVLRDPYSQGLAELATAEEVASFVDAELAAATVKAAREMLSVPKARYRMVTVLAGLTAVAAAVLGWFTYTSYAQAQPRQDAIITAQSHFVTDDYAQTLSALADYSPDELPKPARYVLAVSSVKLTDLTGEQKQAVLDTMSTKTDDNTLSYWIHLARGDLDRALNLAQNLGDEQLTLLAYTDLYQATKLNTTMDGARKQELLDQYGKKIEELTAQLGVAK
ncbi:type VII secretion protein EssB [Leifsonia sp. 2TAF2]|uniref:type VII secretion protein EssB n=1 Tax=Leifsonia sp. 2TAF2 TaxID=3233009 RepID=UPI003F9D6D63